MKNKIFMGAYDAITAKLISQEGYGVFCSGYSISTAKYSLPDNGHYSLSDASFFVQSLKKAKIYQNILVDIDEGFSNPVETYLKLNGLKTWGIVIDDQGKERKCGHLDGKNLLSKDEFSKCIEAIIRVRDYTKVIVRTDSSLESDYLDRLDKYVELEPDYIMVDAISNLKELSGLKKRYSIPIAVNLITGGKNPSCVFTDLFSSGASIIICSTPALFSAIEAVKNYLVNISDKGELCSTKSAFNLSDCEALINEKY